MVMMNCIAIPSYASESVPAPEVFGHGLGHGLGRGAIHTTSERSSA